MPGPLVKLLSWMDPGSGTSRCIGWVASPRSAGSIRLAISYGAKLWAGTMPESGIGSQAAIAAAALPGFVYPSDVEPSTRWFGPDADVIPLAMDSQGRMQVPTSVGRLSADPGTICRRRSAAGGH